MRSQQQRKELLPFQLPFPKKASSRTIARTAIPGSTFKVYVNYRERAGGCNGHERILCRLNAGDAGVDVSLPEQSSTDCQDEVKRIASGKLCRLCPSRHNFRTHCAAATCDELRAASAANLAVITRQVIATRLESSLSGLRAAQRLTDPFESRCPTLKCLRRDCQAQLTEWFSSVCFYTNESLR